MDEGSLLIDSILTQAKTNDCVSMMILADEIVDNVILHSFCTSTQMSSHHVQHSPGNPTLSPLTLGPRGNPDPVPVNDFVDVFGERHSDLDTISERSVALQDQRELPLGLHHQTLVMGIYPT